MSANNKSDVFVEDDKTYSDSYGVFRRGLLEQQKVWVKGVIPLLTQTFPNVEGSTYKILGIGSGWGDVDLLFISQILAEMRKLNITCKIRCLVVERNVEFVDKFKERVKENAKQLQGVSFEWILTTAEDFIQDHTSEKFDFIHCVHSLYYMKEEDVLQKFKDKLLAPKGCILNVVQTEGSIYARNYYKYHKDIDAAWNFFHVITDRRLKETADRNGWQSKVVIGKRKLEVTEMFDDKSLQGRKLLDFFFHAENLHEHIQPDTLNNILTFFEENSFSEQSKKFAAADEGIVLIFQS